MKKNFGVNLIGFIKGEIGLGEGSRLLCHAFDKAGIPFSVYNVEIPNAMPYGDSSFDSRISTELPYPINIIHINPPEMEWLFEVYADDFKDNRYTIGYWLWELDRLPDEWLKTFRLVDEIWTPSEFVSNVFRKCTDKPVRTVPYPITVKNKKKYNRDYFGLNRDLFLFLILFDANSTLERKNPFGAINAYKKAFKDNEEQTGLVIKINNPTPEVESLINSEIEGIKNISVIYGTRTRAEVNGLINCCDVFLSLHRAEGFGLVAAEAMYSGKPVIATNWSANTGFMSEENSCLVNSTLCDIPAGILHYGGRGRWAEPDISMASEYMVRLLKDTQYKKLIAKNASRHMRKNFSARTAGKLLQNILSDIYVKIT